MKTKEYIAIAPKDWGCIRFKTHYVTKTNLIAVALAGFRFKWKKVIGKPAHLKRHGFLSQSDWEMEIRRAVVIIPLKQVNQAETYSIDLDKGTCNLLETKKKTKHLKGDTPTV